VPVVSPSRRPLCSLSHRHRAGRGAGSLSAFHNQNEEQAMKFNHVLAVSMVAASLTVAPAAFAAEPAKMAPTHKMDKMGHMEEFMTSCDMDRDGMMSKAEMVKHMEEMFDRMDAKKTGTLDKKQTEAFLKQFTKPSGG
jgi:hypothetical protein